MSNRAFINRTFKSEGRCRRRLPRLFDLSPELAGDLVEKFGDSFAGDGGDGENGDPLIPERWQQHWQEFPDIGKVDLVDHYNLGFGCQLRAEQAEFPVQGLEVFERV